MKIDAPPSLFICCSNPTDLQHLTQELQGYFGNVLHIVPLNPLTFDTTTPLQLSVILCTGSTESFAEKVFPHATILSVHRALSGKELEKIVTLPKGTRALVVNDPKQNAIETTNAIMDLGIQHINLIPYWPGSGINTQNCSTIIYTGIADDCPKGDFNYINLDHRSIAIETILDIIRHFNLPSHVANAYYFKHIQHITDSCYVVARTLRESKQLQNSFEDVFEINRSCLFVIDEHNQLSLINQMACDALNIQKQTSIGQKISVVFKSHPQLLPLLNTPKKNSETVITLNDVKYYMKLNLFFQKKPGNILISLTSVDELRQTEGNARMQLHASGFSAKFQFSNIIGDSFELTNTIALAKLYARTNSNILITGETGTGKEIFAQAIHNASQHSGQSFVAVNFAALPENLVETELFGYDEGAFTGALKGGKSGLFEIAHNGTLLLDEIGEASLAVQAKILRTLEEREIIHVGGSKVIPVDVRIICATNSNLKAMVEKGTFRADLFYRIKVLNLQLHPLRSRPADICPLLHSMLHSRFAMSLITPKIESHLLEYTWPGNVREVRALAEYINMLSDMYAQGSPLEQINTMLLYFLHSNFPLSVQSLPSTTVSAARPQVFTPDLPPDLTRLLFVLHLCQQQGCKTGRNTLCRIPALMELGLSESKIKSRLKQLASMGFLSIGTTKQSTTLTPKGLSYCKHIAQAHPDYNHWTITPLK